MSIITVFTLFMFTVIIIMIGNISANLDNKLGMQNAADASVYSGSVVVARGMNTISFANHLICDVASLVAFLREGRDNNMIPESGPPLYQTLLDEWEKQIPRLTKEGTQEPTFPKFKRAGKALEGIHPIEESFLPLFSESMSQLSDQYLEILETILAEEMIPQFQQEVILQTDQITAQVVNEVAYRHGKDSKSGSQGPQAGVLWRLRSGYGPEPVGYGSQYHPLERVMPAVDPSPVHIDYGQLPDGDLYYQDALEERRQMTKWRLMQWNNAKMAILDSEFQLGQFANLWRILTYMQLVKLLDEYPQTNLPIMIRHNETESKELQRAKPTPTRNQHLEENFHFVATVHRHHYPDQAKGIFKNRMKEVSDGVTFAQVSVFLPGGRRVRTGTDDLGRPVWGSDGKGPRHWDLWNQNWTSKLVPATSEMIPLILQTSPPTSQGQQGYRALNLSGFNSTPSGTGTGSMSEINKVNTH